MKFAKYWKSVEVSLDKKMVFFGATKATIWGASNESADDAARNADSRANSFIKIISSKEPDFNEYDYWNGYIREEVIEEVLSSDDRVIAVLTRNYYGALVLNSESVFFGDIDVDEGGFFSRFLEVFGKAKKDKTYYIKKVQEFQKANTQYTLNIYETFAGLRVVITNALFDSNSPVVDGIFKALDTDPLYVTLCKYQSCFRARLSPKPWRINMERPPKRFPWNSQRDESDFSKWLRSYEYKSKNFGVVKLLHTFGTDQSNSDVARVLAIHDDYACTSNGVLA